MKWAGKEAGCCVSAARLASAHFESGLSQFRYSDFTPDQLGLSTSIVQSACRGGQLRQQNRVGPGLIQACPLVEHIALLGNGGSGFWHVVTNPAHTLVNVGSSQRTRSGHWKNWLDGWSLFSTRNRSSAVLHPRL